MSNSNDSRDRGDQRVTPLPGSSDRPPRGAKTYILELVEPRTTGEEPQNRGDFYEQRVSGAKVIRDKLKEWLADEGLMEEVFHLGEPTGLLILTIVCTPKVAEELKAFPEIKMVIEDSTMQMQ